MIRYVTDCCGKLAFTADSPIATTARTKCRTHGVVTVKALTGPVVREYECSRCRRSMTCVDPVDDATVCLVCGTETLAIVGEWYPEAQSAPSAEPVESWSSP